MIDWHTHQKLNAVASHRLHMESAKSAQEALDMVASALQDPRYDSSTELNFVGINMRNGDWPDTERMVRQSLDEISPDRPVFLMFNGYHSMVINSAGMARFGLSVDKYPDGILVEKDAFDISHDLSNVGEDVLDQWIFDEAKYAA
jgi:predicted amidohydrolase YtcJ